MLRRLTGWLCRSGWLVLVLPMALHAGTRVMDDMGMAVELDAPPQRIVSLSPHLTELLFSLDLDARIVGVSEYSDYPQAASAIPRIGRHDRFDMERLLALRPDLVVAWKSGNGVDAIQRLRSLGLTVFAAESTNLSAVPGLLEKLGNLTGTQTTASRKATRYRRKLAALTRRYQERDPVRVFFQLWQEPLMTVAGDQYISDAIYRCGGRNLFADLAGKTATVTREAVLERAPELILATRQTADAVSGDAPLAHWHSLAGIPAVNYGQLELLPADTLARPTLRLVKGLEQLCQAIQGTRLKLKNGEHEQ